jgi:flavorubredoxin
VLFTSDIGAAVFGSEGQYLFVEDFDEHLKIMEPFHKRYMTSNKVIKKWLSKVEGLDIKIIAPQHGALFNGENVQKFMNWFSKLECGVDILDSIYG